MIEKEIEVIDVKVKDMVVECEKFVEDFLYLEKNVMYDIVYE